MSKTYELMYVISFAKGEEAVEATHKQVQDLVAKEAEILDVDVWGKRRLAYEINDEKEGYYVVLKFKSEPTYPKEIDRVLKISDNVLRHLITRVDE